MPVQAGPSRRFRRAMFAIFVASFVVVTALVLLEGNGYIIHFPSRSLLTTGSMLVKMQPTNATVTVAGIAHTGGSPVRITRITPRTVPVRIETAGYYPWHKRLAIDPQHATFIDTVLVRNSTLTPLQTFPSSHTVSLSPDGTTVLEWDPYTVSVTSTKISTHSDAGTIVHTITTPFAPTGLSVAWSADSARAALTWNTGTRHATYIFSTVRQEFSGALEHDQLSFVRWDAASPWVAVVRTIDGSLAHFHAITHEVTPRTNGSTPLTRDQHALYVVETTTQDVHSTPLTGDAETTILPFAATQGTSNDDATVLSNEFEVWFSHQQSPFTLLTRTSDTILGAYPVANMPYAVVFTRSRVQLIEYDDRDVRNTYSLFSTSHVSQIGVDKDGHKIRAIIIEPTGEQTLADLLIR